MGDIDVMSTDELSYISDQLRTDNCDSSKAAVETSPVPGSVTNTSYHDRSNPEDAAVARHTTSHIRASKRSLSQQSALRTL